MSHYGPYATSVGLLERAKNLADLQIMNRPQVHAYRLWGSKTLDDAYGAPDDSKVSGAGPAAFCETPSGSTFRSPSIVQRKLGLREENRRGMTRFILDMDDYVGDLSTGVSSDEEVLFVRVQESPLTTGVFNVVGAGLVNAGDPILGPIYVMPSAPFFTMNVRTIPLQGTAPANTGCLPGKVPLIGLDGQTPNPMHIVLPRFTQSVRIVNRGGAVLLVSYGLGETMYSMAPAEDATFIGGVSQLVFASADNTGVAAASVAFSCQAVIAFAG